MNTEQLKRHIQKSDLTALEKRYLEGLVEGQTPREGMRLIDADELKLRKFTAAGSMSEYGRGWNDALAAVVESAPTIEAEPVKNGYWVHCWGKSSLWYCSQCGEKIIYNPERRTRNIAKSAVHELNKYCRACGAKMVGFHSVDYSHREKPTKDIGRG